MTMGKANQSQFRVASHSSWFKCKPGFDDGSQITEKNYKNLGKTIKWSSCTMDVLSHFCNIVHCLCAFAASCQQQVQDQHVPRPSPAEWLSPRSRLHVRTHTGRAGEVSEHVSRVKISPVCIYNLISKR